jgi:hypothetical protein
MSDISLSERIKWAESNLDHQLDWISRHDFRIAVVFAICVAMLGYLAGQTVAPAKLDGTTLTFALLAAVAQMCSLGAIYVSHYPRTILGSKSLLFFGDIGRLDQAQFAASFCERPGEDHLKDICNQAHINSVIIAKKFSALKVALVFLLASTVPWVFAIVLLRLAGAA